MKKLILLAAFSLLPAWAGAEPRVYLNNVDITYLRSQYFENANVTIDALGNINITAPQYSVNVQNADGQKVQDQASYKLQDKALQPEKIEEIKATLPDGNRDVYLDAKFSKPKLFGHSVAVYINGRFVARLNQDLPEQLVNVTEYVHKGRNEIQYQVTRMASDASSSKATVDISFANASPDGQGGFLLDGNASPITIKSADGTKNYDAILIRP